MNKYRIGDVVKAINNELIGAIGIVVCNDYSGFTKVRFLGNDNGYWLADDQITYARGNDYIKYLEYCKNKNSIGLRRDSIKNVIFNPPATIVFWRDGTKTVVKAKNEDFDPEKGLAMAISKKMLGNNGNYYEVFKKWLPKEDTSTGESLSDVINSIKAKLEEKRWSLDFNPWPVLECSSCARFDDERMECTISQPCIGHNRHVKKDTHE